MLRKVFFYSLFFLFAVTVLFISILRTAAIKYSYIGNSTPKTDTTALNISNQAGDKINYPLPYAGTVLPDSVLWPLKAVRDNLWLAVTSDYGRRIELNLLFADKRLVAAEILFNKGNYGLGFTTLAKANLYLKEACRLEEEKRGRGLETGDLIKKLANASLKHRQIITELMAIAPDDLRPRMVLLEDVTRGTYQNKAAALRSKSLEVPISPFPGD